MKIYILVFLSAFVLSCALGFIAIPLLKKLRAGQSILSYVKEHEYKGGTPTMGGLFFVIAAVIVSLAFSDKDDFRGALVICSIGIAYMAVGFLDDYIKIRLRHNEGLKPYQKILFQTAVATIASVYAYKMGYTRLIIPFFGGSIDIKWWAIPLYIFVLLATVNCVNLTDGLDGLAGGVSYVYLLMIAALITLESGSFVMNTAISSISLAGALVGFLLFNTYRAKVFMGDTGSLALGGFISAVSIFSGNALFIPIVGIIFVLTGISVIVQVVYYKKTGSRVFLMAPVHHHFQMKGASESKIAFAYKAVTLAAGLISIVFFC